MPVKCAALSRAGQLQLQKLTTLSSNLAAHRLCMSTGGAPATLPNQRPRLLDVLTQMPGAQPVRLGPPVADESNR